MTKKSLLLILFAICMAAVYAVFFTDWFSPKTVEIFHTNRATRASLRRRASLPNLTFGVSHPLRFTELKVVPVAALATNQNAMPVWHLISDSNSVPVKVFSYGQYIGGMRPYIKGVRPEPLETNVTYRLFITAGKIKGQHDFEVQ